VTSKTRLWLLGLTEVTNQSTGYCPEPSSWGAVVAAIPDGIARPDQWTAKFSFRRCPKCLAINLVKEDSVACVRSRCRGSGTSDDRGTPMPTLDEIRTKLPGDHTVFSVRHTDSLDFTEEL
jgi:hypothetical protein